jgi:hypothetical protein
MLVRSFLPGLKEKVEWHSWVVDDTRRATIKFEGREVLSLG